MEILESFGWRERVGTNGVGRVEMREISGVGGFWEKGVCFLERGCFSLCYLN